MQTLAALAIVFFLRCWTVYSSVNKAAANGISGINTLVGDGARTIVFTVGDVSKLPEATGNPNAPVGSAYSQTYNNLMQIALAGVARSACSEP